MHALIFLSKVYVIFLFQVGLIIGRGGETIKGLQTRSGARIQVVDIYLPQSGLKFLQNHSIQFLQFNIHVVDTSKSPRRGWIKRKDGESDW